MDFGTRVDADFQARTAATLESAIAMAIDSSTEPTCPSDLAAAVRYAVFPGGARVRPRLCMAVAAACQATDRSFLNATAIAFELLHCASLVHDDLPCFDDAPLRRGKPSVHRAFGEPLAVLTGDALIVLAFDTLAVGAVAAPHKLGPILRIVARAVGMPHGIVAGQAWECESAGLGPSMASAHSMSSVSVARYQRAKTGALFVGAAQAGALIADANPIVWSRFAEYLGEAYQVADDIADAVGRSEDLGKPVGRDAALGRPSAVGLAGLAAALQRFQQLMRQSAEAIPACAGADRLRALVNAEAKRILPADLARCAA